MSATDGPPPPNPILSAYETFKNETPLVTRYTITTITVSYFASFIANPSFALNCIPFFTIFKFEVYRILTSALVCNSILSLIFAYISFVDHGKRLEYSMGSTSFCWLMVTLAFTTNVIFLLICFALYGLSGEAAYLYMQSSSIWIILLGVISIECTKAPAGSKRKLFFCEVPTIYYPLGLLGAFSLIGGFQLALTISTAVGYAYGRGHLDRLKMSESRFKRWEDNVLSNFARREGWVVGQAATGSDAWNNMSQGGGGSGFSMFQRPAGGGAGSGASSGGGLSAPGPASAPPEAAKPAGFPKGGGRTLGPTRRPPTAEARAAMLEAASRRSAEENA